MILKARNRLMSRLGPRSRCRALRCREADVGGVPSRCWSWWRHVCCRRTMLLVGSVTGDAPRIPPKAKRAGLVAYGRRAVQAGRGPRCRRLRARPARRRGSRAGMAAGLLADRGVRALRREEVEGLVSADSSCPSDWWRRPGSGRRPVLRSSTWALTGWSVAAADVLIGDRRRAAVGGRRRTRSGRWCRRPGG